MHRHIYIYICVCVCLCVGGWEGLRSGNPTCPPGDMVKIDPRHSLQSEISSDYLKERRKRYVRQRLTIYSLHQ